MCESIGEPVIPSEITYNLEEAKKAALDIGYPVVLRPAFTLGGTGGGFANNEEELIEIGTNAFRLSPVHQVLIEKMTIAPRERFGIPLREDDRCEWDLEAQYEINPEEFLSMGKATPFAGQRVYGRCIRTVHAGRTVYTDK